MRTFPTLALLAVALPLALTACDTYNNGYDDGYYDGQGNGSSRVRVVDFEFDADDYAISDDGTTASFESDDIRDSGDRSRLQTALATAGDGALVVAYVDSRFLINVTTTGQTYSALPVSRAFRGEIPYDVDNDGTADEFVPVETVLSYEYSFDNEDFYFDVVSSDPEDDFAAGQLFGFAIDSDPRLRVVTVPADILNKTTVDWTNYAAVKAAFNLPD